MAPCPSIASETVAPRRQQQRLYARPAFPAIPGTGQICPFSFTTHRNYGGSSFTIGSTNWNTSLAAHATQKLHARASTGPANRLGGTGAVGFVLRQLNDKGTFIATLKSMADLLVGKAPLGKNAHVVAFNSSGVRVPVALGAVGPAARQVPCPDSSSKTPLHHSTTAFAPLPSPFMGSSSS